MIGLLLIATVPGVIAGLFFEDAITEMRSFTAAGLGFIVTGLVLIAGEEIGRRRVLKNDDLASIGSGELMDAVLHGVEEFIELPEDGSDLRVDGSVWLTDARHDATDGHHPS